MNGWAVGLNGTILKTTNSGVQWNEMSSGTTNLLCDVYFHNEYEGVSVGDNGTIIITSNGGTSLTPRSSGTTVQLRSISFPIQSTELLLEHQVLFLGLQMVEQVGRCRVVEQHFIYSMLLLLI